MCFCREWEQINQKQKHATMTRDSLSKHWSNMILHIHKTKPKMHRILDYSNESADAVCGLPDFYWEDCGIEVDIKWLVYWSDWYNRQEATWLIEKAIILIYIMTDQLKGTRYIYIYIKKKNIKWPPRCIDAWIKWWQVG